MFAVLRVAAVAASDTGRRGEFLAAVLAEAGLPFIGLSSQLMLVVCRIGTIAYSDAAGATEFFTAEAADKIPTSLTAGQNMLMVLRMAAVADADTGRRGKLLSAVLADE